MSPAVLHIRPVEVCDAFFFVMVVDRSYLFRCCVLACKKVVPLVTLDDRRAWVGGVMRYMVGRKHRVRSFVSLLLNCCIYFSYIVAFFSSELLFSRELNYKVRSQDTGVFAVTLGTHTDCCILRCTITV